MVEIVSLEELELAPAFFKLPSTVMELETLRYYLINRAKREYIAMSGYWDILAVGTLPSIQDSLVLRQIHIEEEALD